VHCVHGSPKYPSVHMHADAVVLPGEDDEYAGHALHEKDADLSENVFAAHVVQGVSPLVAL
jgi:hypothetical protein